MAQRYSNASRTSISFRCSRRPSRHQIHCLDRSSALHIERIPSIDSPLRTPSFTACVLPLPRKPNPGLTGIRACHKAHSTIPQICATELLVPRPISCLFPRNSFVSFPDLFSQSGDWKREGGRSPRHPQSLMAAPGACGRLVFAQAAHAQPLTTSIGHPWDRQIIDYRSADPNVDLEAHLYVSDWNGLYIVAYNFHVATFTPKRASWYTP